MALISRLGVVLGLDSAEFNAGLGKAEAGLGKFKANSAMVKTGIAALGTAFIAASADAIQFADSINDIAKANEISVGSVLEFSQALSISGGKADSASKLLSSFTNKIDEAAQGSQKTRDSFKELGVSLKDLGNLTEKELLEKTMRGLAGIEDPIRRNAMAMDLFGRAVKGVDIKGMADELQRISGTMEGSDKAFAAIGDSIDRLDRLGQEFKTDMAQSLSTPFSQATEAAASFYKFVKEQNKSLETATGGFNVSDVLMPWKAGMKAYSKIGGAILQSREDALAAKNAKTYTPMAEGNYTPSILQGLKTPAQLRATPETKEQIAEREKIAKQIQSETEALNQQTRSLKLQTAELGNQKSEYQKILLEFEKGGKYEHVKDKIAKEALLTAAKEKDIRTEQVETAKILYDLDVARVKEMQQDLEAQRVFKQGVNDVKISAERLDYERQLGQLSTTETQKALAYFDLRAKIARMAEDEVNMSESQKKVLQEQIDLLTEAEQLKINAADDLAKYQKTFQGGWDKAYADFVERSTNSAALAADAFNSMAGSMTSALDNFVETGKLSFGNLISSMIKDLLRLSMQSQMSGILGSIFGGAGGGGFGLFSSSTLFNNGGGLLGGFFADGGEPPINKPSVVGENGPELFIPKTSGTIIPNNSLAGAMGNQPQVIYNGPYIANMSAIDTQSATQFLARNKTAVWSANQSAQRSLPQSR